MKLKDLSKRQKKICFWIITLFKIVLIPICMHIQKRDHYSKRIFVPKRIEGHAPGKLPLVQ